MPCRKTFTILPDWLAPSAHYSLHCRQQACERIAAGDSVEQAAPHCKDPSRLPDPSTVRRWAQRRLLSVCCWLKAGAIGASLFSSAHHPCLGSRARSAVFCRSRQEVRESSGSRRVETADSACWAICKRTIGSPARPLSRGRWMGLCPLHADHKPSFLVDPNKRPVLLLRLWPRRRRDSLRRTLSPGEVPASRGVAAPMAWLGAAVAGSRYVSIAFSYTATARRLPIYTNAESARRS